MSSAGFAELFHPAAQHAIVWLFEVEKLDAHADARLDNAHHAERFELLVFPRQREAHACVGRHGLAGADENSTHREVGGYAFGLRAGFQVQNDDVRGKRIADAKAAVPEREAPGFVARCAVIHENYVAHRHSRGDKGPCSRQLQFAHADPYQFERNLPCPGAFYSITARKKQHGIAFTRRELVYRPLLLGTTNWRSAAL